jgi:hypothetical protein
LLVSLPGRLQKKASYLVCHFPLPGHLSLEVGLHGFQLNGKRTAFSKKLATEQKFEIKSKQQILHCIILKLRRSMKAH